jgi:hypothetical protein
MGIPIDYLLPYVRMRVGDTNPTSYRYEDQWLISSLIFAVKLSARYWNNKYTITDKGYVTRNSQTTFSIPEDYGTIEDRDEPVIVLLATIVILEGSLENSAWSVASWKDAEISFTNLEGGRIRNDTVRRLHDELNSLVTSPSKKLARTIKGHLPGFNIDGSNVEKSGF